MWISDTPLKLFPHPEVGLNPNFDKDAVLFPWVQEPGFHEKMLKQIEKHDKRLGTSDIIKLSNKARRIQMKTTLSEITEECLGIAFNIGCGLFIAIAWVNMYSSRWKVVVFYEPNAWIHGIELGLGIFIALFGLYRIIKLIRRWRKEEGLK
jgi:hypothetical protein